MGRVYMEAENQKIKILKILGISMLLAGFLLAVVVTNKSGEYVFTENIFMTVATVAAVAVVSMGSFVISIIIAAVSTISFAGYKIYNMMAGMADFEYVSFLWIIIPVMCTMGMFFYSRSFSAVTLENAVLKQQVEELVMIDRLTGLYNLRSMYMDIQTQISYSERKNSPVSLMILRLRYPVEMRKVLKKEQYEKVIKQLSLLIGDTVRMEDRVYSIDNMGGFGIILTCDKEGTKLVEKRLRDKLEEPKWFEGVSGKAKIRAEVKIGYLEYNKDKYNRDANAFKEDVEEEVDYDMGVV